MSSLYLTKIKVGDKVWSPVEGWGVVVPSLIKKKDILFSSKSVEVKFLPEYKIKNKLINRRKSYLIYCLYSHPDNWWKWK